MIQGDYKLIIGKRVDGSAKRFLCEITADPKEQSNLAMSQPDRVQAMQQAAESLRRSVTTKPQPAPVVEMMLDPEEERSLRSLGYIR